MSAEGPWDTFSKWIAEAGARALLLPVEADRSRQNAQALGVTERSSLWAMATNVGAILIDDGWVRVLGGGAADLRADLASWNGLSNAPTFTTGPSFMVVGFDVMGGIFALDGGALGEGRGLVYYFAPDSLSWEPTGMGYTRWLEWLLTDAAHVDEWFESQRWTGWREEVAPLSLDTAISAYPFAWSKEGKDPNLVSRAPVAAAQVVEAAFQFARDLGEPGIPCMRRAPL